MKISFFLPVSLTLAIPVTIATIGERALSERTSRLLTKFQNSNQFGQGFAEDVMSPRDEIVEEEDRDLQSCLTDGFCSDVGDDTLCFTVRCCGSGCTCALTLNGRSCSSCFVCSNDNISWSCNNVACGTCVGQGCDTSCIVDNCPTAAPRPSSPAGNNPSPSIPSTQVSLAPTLLKGSIFGSFVVAAASVFVSQWF